MQLLKKNVRGLLEAKNLTIKYPGSKFKSLDGINFKIHPGELIAIVGPVGCGKTTLSKTLGRTIEISESQLFLHDINAFGSVDSVKQLFSQFSKTCEKFSLPQ